VPGGERPALVWLTRDLRVRDHPALAAALSRGSAVIPVFCFDRRLLRGRHASGPRTQFLLECLMDLRDSLRERGADLVVRRGPPERELIRIAAEVGAPAIHASDDVSPFARRRLDRVRSACRRANIALELHEGVAIVPPAELRTGAGKPYTVFSPFHRSWLRAPRRNVLRAPSELASLPSRVAVGRIPSLAGLGLEQEVAEPAVGGESQAARALDRFLGGPVRDYGSANGSLADEGTSRLSPFLHLGCLSPRQIEERLPRGSGADAFRRQLAWRDFYQHVLLHFPRNARSEFQDRYRGRIRWSYAERRFDAWRQGKTGFPLVDAGMRQLLREGWMHNRTRLVVGSFLTKDLGIDWRWGERWFMRMLIDGDEANNNGNWQWIASVGTDPQPAFRRMYNPARQQERHDPDGRYVRRYVPELASVPDEFIREPATMPERLQREVGCVIGVDYPAPMVDHARARQEALERYRVAEPRGRKPPHRAERTS
jgi:deoxyribodipyrimidine photo-lyase